MQIIVSLCVMLMHSGSGLGDPQGKCIPLQFPNPRVKRGVKMNLSSYLLFFYISVEGNRFESVDGFQTKMCIRDAYARFQ